MNGYDHAVRNVGVVVYSTIISLLTGTTGMMFSYAWSIASGQMTELDRRALWSLVRFPAKAWEVVWPLAALLTGVAAMARAVAT